MSNQSYIGNRPADSALTAEQVEDGIISEAKLDEALVDAIAAMMAVPGRLTLTTATPVTTSDVTGATTVYFTPYKGNRIPLYDGTKWTLNEFTELSQLTTDATKSPAAVAASKNYDVFVWNDSGTLRATRGPTWDSGAVAGSDTARGTGAGSTELELFEGRYVNKNDITNGPTARKGLYVGTIRSDGSSQINDSMALRHVWNTHNRVLRPMRNAPETTDTWNYSTSALRQANGNAANQLDFVRGLNEDAVRAQVVGCATSASNGKTCYTGIGLDATNANATGFQTFYNPVVVGGDFQGMVAQWAGFPGIGRHYLAWLEQGDGSGGIVTFQGDNGQPTLVQSGINGEMLA